MASDKEIYTNFFKAGRPSEYPDISYIDRPNPELMMSLIDSFLEQGRLVFANQRAIVFIDKESKMCPQVDTGTASNLYSLQKSLFDNPDLVRQARKLSRDLGIQDEFDAYVTTRLSRLDSDPAEYFFPKDLP